jgi:transposase
MIAVGSATRVYLAVGATDMRKGFDGLADLARHVLEVDPLSGHLCLFCNRRRTRIKALYFDGSGMWMCSKRLERGRYSWPGAEAGVARVSLSAQELALLLGGIELERVRRKDWWRREVA